MSAILINVTMYFVKWTNKILLVEWRRLTIFCGICISVDTNYFGEVSESGLKRRSWKPLCVTAPWVRILPSPLGVSKLTLVLTLILLRKLKSLSLFFASQKSKESLKWICLTGQWVANHFEINTFLFRLQSFNIY